MPQKPKKSSAQKSNGSGPTGAAVNTNWESALTAAPFEEVSYLSEHFQEFNWEPKSSLLRCTVAK